MRKKLFCLLTTLIIFYTTISGCLVKNNDKEWDERGELLLILNSEKNTMNYNSNFDIIYKLMNIGNNTIGVLDWNFPWVEVYYLNNSLVDWIGPVVVMSSPSNEDIKVLKSGEFIEYNYSISRMTWDIKQNETYKIQVIYKSFYEKEVTKPYWKGEIFSNTIEFEVK